MSIKNHRKTNQPCLISKTLRKTPKNCLERDTDLDSCILVVLWRLVGPAWAVGRAETTSRSPWTDPTENPSNSQHRRCCCRCHCYRLPETRGSAGRFHWWPPCCLWWAWPRRTCPGCLSRTGIGRTPRRTGWWRCWRAGRTPSAAEAGLTKKYCYHNFIINYLLIYFNFAKYT